MIVWRIFDANDSLLRVHAFLESCCKHMQTSRNYACTRNNFFILHAHASIYRFSWARSRLLSCTLIHNGIQFLLIDIKRSSSPISTTPQFCNFLFAKSSANSIKQSRAFVRGLSEHNPRSHFNKQIQKCRIISCVFHEIESHRAQLTPDNLASVVQQASLTISHTTAALLCHFRLRPDLLSMPQLLLGSNVSISELWSSSKFLKQHPKGAMIIRISAANKRCLYSFRMNSKQNQAKWSMFCLNNKSISLNLIRMKFQSTK